MDTAWIQVFVLVFSQCTAPPGKTVCQEQELQYQFLTQVECEQVLEQLVAYKDEAENVIVDRSASRCLPTVKSHKVYTSMEQASQASADLAGFGELPADGRQTDFIQKAHEERLEDLFECEETGGIAPCKMGNIIIEGATERRTEIWRQQ